MLESKKRETAYKLRIGDLLRGNPIFQESEDSIKRLKFLELGDKQIIRVNVVGNVVDKYQSEGERRFASITLDDGSGQIRARVFGEDVKKFQNLVQGDTILIIGLLRFYNEETYILPELIKIQNPKYLVVRKLEIEKSYQSVNKGEIKVLRDEIVNLIKISEPLNGIEKEDLIMKVKASPELVSKEIQKLIEEGIIYEPRPGRVRYLGS